MSKAVITLSNFFNFWRSITRENVFNLLLSVWERISLIISNESSYIFDQSEINYAMVSRTVFECSYCNKQGHLEDFCYLKYPEKRPHKNGVNKIDITMIQDLIAKAKKFLSCQQVNSCSEVTIPEQCTYFMKSNDYSHSDDLIIDSAATSHMFVRRELFPPFKLQKGE